MAVKGWNYPQIDPKVSLKLQQEYGLSPFLSDILASRKLLSSDLVNSADLLSMGEEFPDPDEFLESPFALADMEKAVTRIRQGIDLGEKMVIYGDYDCDGVTSIVLLYSYLQLLGADVSYYIPNREKEGYGMNKDAVERLADEGTDLIITVDNGISALREIELANRLGMDVIVTDHHQPGEELPDAVAVVDPHRRDCPSHFKFLAGVGVAFKLAVALEDGFYPDLLEQFGDLVAIGTVGDVVSLTGENRFLVRYGLSILERTNLLGLQTLMEKAGLPQRGFTSQHLAFGIVPRINAAGRMGDAGLAVRLLLSEEEEEAVNLAEELNAMNQKRKSLESGILEEIEMQIESDPSLLSRRVLTFSAEGWHKGVIGIVSSKVLERYGKPNILFSEKNGVLSGSARSVEGFSLFEALTACKDYFLRYGGHTQAAGMTLQTEAYDGFVTALENYARETHTVMPGYTYQIDKILSPGELSLEHIRELNFLEPFGADNEQPLFLVEKAVLRQIIPVSENKHLRLKFDFGSVAVTGMLFSTSTEQFCYQPGDVLDFVCNISINPYRGREYLSVVIKDLRPHGFVQQNYFNGKTYYEMFVRDEPLKPTVVEKMIPARGEITTVYRYLTKQKGFFGEVDFLYTVFAGEMNYCQYRLSLDILQDVGLLKVSPLLDRITLLPWTEKVDLNEAETMCKLQKQAHRNR